MRRLTLDIEHSRLVPFACACSNALSVTEKLISAASAVVKGRHCCWGRAAQAESAQAKASQGRASRRLDDEAAQARAAVASCQAELTRTGALHQQELHAKDILISQLKAALTAEEAARAAAAEQQRLAQQDARRLQVR